MADAFSAAGGAISIISFGIQITQGLLQYYTAWDQCDKNTTMTLNALAGLCRTLELIKEMIKKVAIDPEMERHIEESVGACKTYLEALEKKLNKIKGTQLPLGQVIPASPEPSSSKFKTKIRKESQRLLYPFKESTLVKIREVVSDLRDDLALALEVLDM